MSTSTNESTSTSSATSRTLTQLVPPFWCQLPSPGGVPGECGQESFGYGPTPIAWTNLTLDSGMLYFDGISPKGDPGGGFMEVAADSGGYGFAYVSSLPSATPLPTPTQSAVDGDFLYFINSSNSASYTIDVFQISTRTVTSLYTGPYDGDIQSLIVQGGVAYWMESPPCIRSAVVSGTASLAPQTLATGDWGWLSADSTNLYWVGAKGATMMPLAGGTPVPVANGALEGLNLQGFPPIFSDGTYLYGTVGAYPSAEIFQVPIAGGTVVTLASDPGGLTLQLVDGPYVYYALSDGSVMKVSTTEFEAVPEKIAMTGAISTFISDDTSLYWTSTTAEAYAIWRLTPK